MSIGVTRVPFEGPKDYNILCVGEAPGGEEAGQGRPFVGKAGQLLEDYLGRKGIARKQVRLANLCKHRPPDNKFNALLGSDELYKGLDELEEEIKRVEPNVIIALGAWPMYFLTGAHGKVKGKWTPGSGIFNYRGSRLPTVERWGEGRKVFCTFHPSYIRRVWKWNPVFLVDMMHAIEDSEYPELNYPQYEKYIDPAPDILYDLTHEAMKADWVSLDIENFKGGRYSCVGWTWVNDGVMKAVCQTYKRHDLMKYSKEVWESEVPKIFQFGTHDVGFMKRFYGWKVGGFYDGKGWDTYLATASIYPDYPRNLGFLTSLYTRMPYYKEERTTSKETGDMETLWNYNMKDTVSTHIIAMGQMPEIKVLFK